MKALKLYTRKECLSFVNTRQGETKLGETIQCITTLEDLKTQPSKYVVFGIPEDIGIRANYGKSGAKNTWDNFLSAFLNIQVNLFNSVSKVTLLGKLDCDAWLTKASLIDTSDPNFSAKLHDIIKNIDTQVAQLVEHICEIGKIPIIIGGGHNNAYGNLKGLFKAMQHPINVINIDAHTDLRTTTYRHSGNGFSLAKEENILHNYVIFGLHKNYTPHYIFKLMDTSKDINYVLFEDILDLTKAQNAFKTHIKAISNLPFGLEIDCDAIANFPSSAQTPTGFSFEQIRDYINIAKHYKTLSYIHICEAKPSLQYNTGKALSYLVSDILQN